MLSRTNMGFADYTWNPVTGCTRYSDGCDNCYIFGKIKFQMSRGVESYKHGSLVSCHKSRIVGPASKIKPKRFYICSMGDLFHEKVPTKFIDAVFRIVNMCPQHVFMVTTKRTKRLRQLAACIDWPPNLWVGARVESDKHLGRINDLFLLPTENRFVSFEPLIGSFNHVDLQGLKWVSVAGETGRTPRPMDISTVRMIRDEAQYQSIPFYFRNWDSTIKKDERMYLDGVVWQQIPPAWTPIRTVFIKK